MKKVLFITILTLSALSCGNPYVIQSLQEESVPQIPCSAGQIEVIQHVINDDGSATWTALCSGRTYSCQRLSGPNGEVNCSEMESQMPE